MRYERGEKPDDHPESILEPLVTASSQGDLEAARQILEKWLESPDPHPRKDPQKPFRRLHHALEAAIASGNLHVADYFLGKGFNIIRFAVEAAIENTSIEALELLLNYGWDINDRWEIWRQPSIWLAIHRSSLPLVTWFLTHGASPNLEPNAYRTVTPLTTAAKCGSLEITQLLLSHGADVTQGDVAAATIRSDKPEEDREPVLRHLLEQGAPVNELEWGGNATRQLMNRRAYGLKMPLHLGVEEEKWRLVRLLVEFGADWDAEDSDGVTAREMMVGRGGEERVREMGVAKLRN